MSGSLAILTMCFAIEKVIAKNGNMFAKTQCALSFVGFRRNGLIKGK